MKTKYQQLNIEERILIQLGLQQRLTLRAIARSVNRAPSTISRECRRNGWKSPAEPAKPGRPPIAGGYQALSAQQRADDLLAKPRAPQKLLACPALRQQVFDLLLQRNSPEQIAGILHRMFPDTPALNLSHESIYSAIYAMPMGDLRKQLIAALRQSRKKRRPRTRGTDRRGQIPDMVSIHVRPPEINERIVPGHWEGDLIKGKGNQSAIGTLVERTTLFVTLVKLASSRTEEVVEGFSRVFNRIDAQKRLSMTYDQGREMTDHAKLTEATGVKVFFADPHSSWQRGRNENTNGLLRQYLPKGEDLSVFSQEAIDAIAWQLNLLGRIPRGLPRLRMEG